MPVQMLTTRATPKATKQAARYTPAGGAERCGQCRHYVPSSACARIEGPISAAGWCMLYSQQVTWRPRAGQDAGFNPGLVPSGVTLDLSFLTPGTLDPRITFTRASTATYFDSTGTMRTAAANAPRWDYDPVTHALRGLLIEEARTNLALNSGDASNASWTKTGITVAAPTVTGNQTVAPDGTTTAARVVMPAVSAAGNASYVNPVIMILTTQPYSLSVWLKGNVGGEQLYLSATPDGSTYFRLPVTLTTSWQRFTLTTANLTGVSWYLIVGTDRRDAGQSATLAQTFFIWGAQLEQGAFPTSYIPTTAASVTRAADACQMPTGAWFNANTTTLMLEAYLPVAPPGALAGFGDGVNFGNSFYLAYGPPSCAIRAGGGTANSGTLTFGAVNKMAATNTATQIQCSTNGAVAGSAAQSASALTTTTLLAIGLGPWNMVGGQMNGHMRRVRYWPRALTNAELQSVTT